MSLLGIDVGTTACKIVAFSEDGQPLASASREYQLHTPQPDHVELDPDEVWTAVATCIREVNASVDKDPVVAMAVSSQGEAVTPIGPDGQALARSPVTFDNRAVSQMERLEQRVGRQMLARTTGQLPHAMHTVAKLMWWQDHAPELVRRTLKFLCYGDLISVRLGAYAAIDFSMAARTMAFDISDRHWSSAILTTAGIDGAKLPEPVPAGTVVGRMSAEIAANLGFHHRALIVAGGHDQPCGAFGAGVAADGEAMFAIGTTVCLAPAFDAPSEKLLDRDYPCYPHVVPGRYISLAGNFTGGSLLRWYRDTLGETECQVAAAAGRDVYDVLTETASAEPSPLLVLPHFAGAGAPHNDPAAKGAVLGLTFATDRGQVIRSLLEGVMFEMALNRERLAEAGVAINTAVAIGGGARSDRWLQIAADILGVPIRRSAQPEAACWGAARLAGIGVGILSPLAAEPAPSPAEASIFSPDPTRMQYYQNRLSVYRSAYAALQPVNYAL